MAVPPPASTAAAVIVAAGAGRRMAAGARGEAASLPRKPWLELAGRTLLERSCAAFDACPAVLETVLVVHADDLERAALLRERSPALAKVSRIVPGGAERTDSVREGVRACSAVDVVAVHDAARPLVDPALIARAIERAAEEGAALLALAVADTIKRSTDGRAVEATLERRELWAAQTPQCFRRARFLELLLLAEREGLTPTDDAALWERAVGPVAIVESTAGNLKITRPADLAIAAALLAEREEARR